MSYPEPSEYDHGAVWTEGEDGECDCVMCRRRRQEEYREDSGYYEDLYERRREE